MVPASHREFWHSLLKIHCFFLFRTENYADADDTDHKNADDDDYADEGDDEDEDEDDNEDDDEDEDEDVHPFVSLHLTELPLLRFRSLPSPVKQVRH